MPKLPKLRLNFHADAQYLLRLTHAIEADQLRPMWWRYEAARLASSLAHLFLNAPEPDGQVHPEIIQGQAQEGEALFIAEPEDQIEETESEAD